MVKSNYQRFTKDEVLFLLRKLQAALYILGQLSEETDPDRMDALHFISTGEVWRKLVSRFYEHPTWDMAEKYFEEFDKEDLEWRIALTLRINKEYRAKQGEE